MRFFWLRPAFIVRRAEQPATRESIEGPQLAGASARRTTHRSVGMRDVDVHLVMAVIAISGAGQTRHELGLCARRLELDDLAQIYPSFLLARASARSLKPASRMSPSASAWL